MASPSPLGLSGATFHSPVPGVLEKSGLARLGTQLVRQAGYISPCPARFSATPVLAIERRPDGTVAGRMPDWQGLLTATQWLQESDVAEVRRTTEDFGLLVERSLQGQSWSGAEVAWPAHWGLPLPLWEALRDIPGWPLGPYHGDLTWANVLFSPEAGAPHQFIDFLDQTPETPLWDAAKLLQECTLGWSWFLQPAGDVVRYQRVMAWLFERLEPLRHRYPEIDVLWQVALYRVLPYATPRITQHILTTLHQGDPRPCHI